MIEPLTKFKKILKENKLDAALISSIPNIIYLTGYSGFSKAEREAYLFITKNKQCVLTDGRYSQAVKALVPDFELVETSSKLSAMDALKRLTKKYNIKKLGFEGHNITHLEHKRLSKTFKNAVHLNLTSLRDIKSSKEILAIEEACELGDKTFDYILKKIKFGVSEKELAFEIEFFIKKHGADISFRPIVAFGKNSAIPHHVPTHNSKLLTHNSIVLLDFGVKLNNHCSDMTRTVFFGSANAEFKKIYKTVLEAQSRAIKFLTSDGGSPEPVEGHDSSEVDRIARDYIISKGYTTIPHSVGHGIGIDVHESPHLSPKSKDILKEGMVFSIEPGIYIPGFGGIRIEEVVVLEKSKIRILTHSKKTLIEI